MSKIVIISGATSVGKSKLAIDFALNIKKRQKSAIINADSLQIYQGLPILSAQPFLKDRKEIDHYLYSFLGHDQKFSVMSWLKELKSLISDLKKQKILPIIVGGTGMYISSLVNGISKTPNIKPEIRKLAKNYYNNYGLEKLQQKLISLGEKKIIDPQRLIRAYEIYLQSGNILSFYQQQPKQKIIDDFDFIHINFNIKREDLYNNCNNRFKEIIKLGAIQEVEAIRPLLSDNSQISKTIGYQEICKYLDKEINKQEMIEIISQKTRNYAKRQLTWFRNQKLGQKTFDKASNAIEYLNEIL